MTYTYDTADQVIGMTAANGQKTAFAYNNDAKRTDTWFHTDTAHSTFAAHTKTSFDAAGRIARTWTSRNSSDTTKTFDSSYCYSPYVPGQACPAASASTDTAVIRWSVDNLTTARSTYTYDTSNRLTAVANYGGHDYAYTYDKAGNRTSVKVDGTATPTVSYNSGNQISSTGYSHDAAGNRTAHPAQGAFTYNAAGQTKTRTHGASTTSYTWGGADQNELVAKTTAANTTSYVYGRNDRNGVAMVQSITTNGQTSYLDHDPSGSPIALHEPGGVTHYYALDNQGTPVNLINNTGAVTASYTYDPAGKQITATGAAAALNPLRHTQGLLDEDTGWLKHGIRWQDTTTSNWTALDPIALRSEPSLTLEPDTASHYATQMATPPTTSTALDEPSPAVSTTSLSLPKE